MTLSIGNHLVKLDHEGKPIIGDNAGEVHVEYEIAELGNLNWKPDPNAEPHTPTNVNQDAVFAILRKVR